MLNDITLLTTSHTVPLCRAALTELASELILFCSLHLRNLHESSCLGTMMTSFHLIDSRRVGEAVSRRFDAWSSRVETICWKTGKENANTCQHCTASRCATAASEPSKTSVAALIQPQTGHRDLWWAQQLLSYAEINGLSYTFGQAEGIGPAPLLVLSSCPANLCCTAIRQKEIYAVAGYPMMQEERFKN